jgi:diguanylate cyclase (GGDEF)-like protein
MIRTTIATRIALAMGALVFLFFATNIVAYVLTARSQHAPEVAPVLVYLSVMTSLGALIGVAAALVLIRGIVRPIRELTDAVDAFGRGEFDYRVDMPRDDEIGVLAYTFNAMAESRQQAESRLEDLAYHDPLTQLPNRALFQRRLTEALLNAQRGGQGVAVLLLDLDHFKYVNDTLGHPAGDRLLQVVSQRLLDCVRETDTVARLGGDEFAIIQTHLGERGHVVRLAERVIESLSTAAELQHDQVHTGTSIGITLYPDDATQVDELLRGADLALYRAKHEGRGTFYLYDSTLDQEIKQRAALERDLRGALDSEELFLVYQPMQDARTGRISGAEALIRWVHGVRGNVRSDQLVAVAEQAGLIGRLTDFVLRRACEDVQGWQIPGEYAFRVSVNLSALDFKRQDLVEQVNRTLARTGLEPERLELEVTERILMQQSERVNGMLNLLRQRGIDLAIDDFGTGYSSLRYLKRYPLSRIKIDRSFISQVETDSSDASIARSVVTMAHGLGMKVIAEGVETEWQANFLANEGCDELQGHFISTALGSAEFQSFLHARLAAVRPASGDEPLCRPSGRRLSGGLSLPT